MPPGGIAVSVFFPSVTTPFRPLKLTLPARPATFLEGTTDTPEYRIQGRVGGRDVYVWVDVRRERPSALDLRIAQRVVSSIRFGGGAGRSTVFHGPGITLRTPSGWWANNKPLTAITNPVQRFVLSSYRIPVGADAGESYVPSPRGVLAELTEDVPAGGSARGWPPRPRQFVLPRLGRMETLNGDRWGEVLFREHGRHFYLFIWVVRDASPAQVAVLLRALAGMTIRRS